MTSVPGLTNTTSGLKAKLAAMEWNDRTTIAKFENWNDFVESKGGVINLDANDWNQFNENWMNSPQLFKMKQERIAQIKAMTKSEPVVIQAGDDAAYNLLLPGMAYIHPANGQMYYKVEEEPLGTPQVGVEIRWLVYQTFHN